MFGVRQLFWKKSALKFTLWTVLMAASGVIQAQDTLEQKAEQARHESHQLELSQLEKAKAAAAETQLRQQKISEKQQQGADWEQEQKNKAQSQFNEREQRQKKYLQDAKSAAKKQRKISP